MRKSLRFATSNFLRFENSEEMTKMKARKRVRDVTGSLNFVKPTHVI